MSQEVLLAEARRSRPLSERSPFALARSCLAPPSDVASVGGVGPVTQRECAVGELLSWPYGFDARDPWIGSGPSDWHRRSPFLVA